MGYSMHWIKFSTQTFDDEKIKLIEHLRNGDTVLIVFFKLLTKAAKLNGVIALNENTPYSDKQLTQILGKHKSTVRMSLKVLSEYGLIEINDGFIYVNGWEKHQATKSIEDYLEKNRQRVRKYREKQKQPEKMHHLQVYISELPQVSKLPHQITYKDAEDLMKKYDIDIMKDILNRMDNYRDLTKKYVSVKRTMENWIKNANQTKNRN